MKATQIIVIAYALVTSHYHNLFTMMSDAVQFPADSQNIIFSYTIDVTKNNPKTIIHSIKMLWKKRLICKYFDAIIQTNIVTWLKLVLDRHGLEITDILDESNRSVLHAVCEEKIDSPILSTILLNATGQNALQLITIKNLSKLTCLYCATEKMYSQTIEVFLNFAKDQAPTVVLMPNKACDPGTALRTAVLRGNLKIVRILLNAAGSKALDEIIMVLDDARVVLSIVTLIEENSPLNVTKEMVDLLESYKEKYQSIDTLCQKFDTNFIL